MEPSHDAGGDVHDPGAPDHGDVGGDAAVAGPGARGLASGLAEREDRQHQSHPPKDADDIHVEVRDRVVLVPFRLEDIHRIRIGEGRHYGGWLLLLSLLLLLLLLAVLDIVVDGVVDIVVEEGLVCCDNIVETGVTRERR